MTQKDLEKIPKLTLRRICDVSSTLEPCENGAYIDILELMKTIERDEQSKKETDKYILELNNLLETAQKLLKNSDVSPDVNDLKIKYKCKCTTEQTTGNTSVQCCNICGLPIQKENWDFFISKKTNCYT